MLVLVVLCGLLVPAGALAGDVDPQSTITVTALPDIPDYELNDGFGVYGKIIWTDVSWLSHK